MFYLKNGLNPVAGLTQTHYLKGFFLMHFLMERVGEAQFLRLIRKYFEVQTGMFISIRSPSFASIRNKT